MYQTIVTLLILLTSLVAFISVWQEWDTTVNQVLFGVTIGLLMLLIWLSRPRSASGPRVIEHENKKLRLVDTPMPRTPRELSPKESPKESPKPRDLEADLRECRVNNRRQAEAIVKCRLENRRLRNSDYGM